MNDFSPEEVRTQRDTAIRELDFWFKLATDLKREVDHYRNTVCIEGSRLHLGPECEVAEVDTVKLGDLFRRLAVAEKDVQRLDWLEAQVDGDDFDLWLIEVDHIPNRAVLGLEPSTVHGGLDEDLRDAIDAARKSEA